MNISSKCPCCDGAGVIALPSRFRLTPMQFRLWDALRRSPDGLSCSDLTDRVYADRADGGPTSGTHCIWVHAHNANKRLKAIGQRIVGSKGHGSVYRLESVKPEGAAPK